MIFKKPKFWDLKKSNLFSILLLPFTLPIKINNFILNYKPKKFTKLKLFVWETFILVEQVKLQLHLN